MIYSFITKHKPEAISFKRACKELEVSPSGYFKHLKKEGHPNQLCYYEQKVLKAFDLNKGFLWIQEVISLLER